MHVTPPDPRVPGSGGAMHFKWDDPGKGTHTAVCWQCNWRNHDVTWSSTGKIKE